MQIKGLRAGGLTFGCATALVLAATTLAQPDIKIAVGRPMTGGSAAFAAQTARSTISRTPKIYAGAGPTDVRPRSSH
jgi:hypothetical protein